MQSFNENMVGNFLGFDRMHENNFFLEQGNSFESF
jgi:hypothetical protein